MSPGAALQTSANRLDPELELRRDIAAFTHRPLAFVRYAYPWGEQELTDSGGPWPWQREILQAIEAHLRAPATRHQPCQVAVSSGHGVGKSALVAMILAWAMSTCEDAKVVITANTGTQLATKTAPEIAKWHRLAINRHWFESMATSVSSRAPAHERTWRADLIPWSENNTEAFAGLHNKGKRIVVIFDEASAIADKIWEVTEGALTDEGTEILWLAFGNPTQNTGRFFECFGRFAHRWKTFRVDSRTVEATNKQQIEKWVADYGEDSDFVRVRVRGEFPRAGASQFIPGDVVARCRKYVASGNDFLPKILAIDVARFGDDRTVFALRQGRAAKLLGKFRELSTIEVAMRAIEVIDRDEPDAVVVDGDGIGAGVVDQLAHRGYGRRLFEFHGGERANDPAKYFNRRAEVWGEMRDALVAGMQIDDDPDLDADLTGPEYGFSARQQIQLERKEDMKRRGLASPDTGDALAMTFAVRIATTKKPTKPKMVYPGEQSQSWMA